MKNNSKTGNATVDAIGQLEDKLIGPLIPYPWFTKILDKRGRPYHLAILVLGEIVGWYKPKYEVAKGSNDWIARKRFKRDRLQLSRGYLAKKFNTDEDAVTNALNCLVKLGAIKKQCMDLVVQGRTYRNSLFVWPVPEVIGKLCEVEEPKYATGPTEEAEVAPIMGATWPRSQGPDTPDDGGNVGVSNGPRGPVDPGDVAPVMGVDTGTTRESDRKTTATTNGNPHGAKAPVAVVVKARKAGASPPAPPASCLSGMTAGTDAPAATAPPAQLAKKARKVTTKCSPANGAERQTAGQQAHPDMDDAAVASVPEADAALSTSGAGTSEARKLLQLYEKLYWRFFEQDYRIKQQDVQIANQYFQDHPDRLALEVANYLLGAWELRDQTDGDYGYGCCKQAKTVAGFFKFLERDDGKLGICEDVEGVFGGYWQVDEEDLIKSLVKICGDKEVIRAVFAEEYGRIKRQKEAEAEEDAKRAVEAERLREKADKKLQAERQARIENPTSAELNSAHETLVRAYNVALKKCTGFPETMKRLDNSCKILRLDLPALHEWYRNHSHRKSVPEDIAENVPDELLTRLKDEYSKLVKGTPEISAIRSS